MSALLLRTALVILSAACAAAPARGRQQTGGAHEPVVIRWAEAGRIAAMPAWAGTPATSYRSSVSGGAASFDVAGVGKEMRWTLALPRPIDLRALPWVSVRYRASGTVSRDGYSLRLSERAPAGAGAASVVLLARDLVVDGQWHTAATRAATGFDADEVQVGLGSAGLAADLTLAQVRFTATPPEWSVADLLPYSIRSAASTGTAVLAPLPPGALGGVPARGLQQRLGLADWFGGGRVTVAGIPFDVPQSAESLTETGVAQKESLSVKLPQSASEVYVLTAACVQPTQQFGTSPAAAVPLGRLDHPEQVAFEVQYADGPPDVLLPIDVADGQWGLRPGLAVQVLHPDRGRRPIAFVLHDHMSNASFAVVGATVRTGPPVVPEPEVLVPAYTASPMRLPGGPARLEFSGDTLASGALEATIGSRPGELLRGLAVPGMPDALACAPTPLFEVTVGGRPLADRDWVLVASKAEAGATPNRTTGRRLVLEHKAAHLTATLDCLATGDGGLRLRLQLRNDGPATTDATVRFPVIRGLQVGTPGDTWYLYGRRGGILSDRPAAFRDPLGERHPLQVDGFYSPAAGVALACLTHDTRAQHHWREMSLSREGGAWSIEYPHRQIGAGQSFGATEAELAVCAGDWRAILERYSAWVATWFKPPREAKPWFTGAFAFMTHVVDGGPTDDPRTRGLLQPAVATATRYLGACDLVHVLGWPKTDRYGQYGDYDHYDETVGGADAFRTNITDAQRNGTAVGLYLDAYLNCERGQFAGTHAREWAMRDAKGEPVYDRAWDAFEECPYQAPWRAYLAGAYARVHRDLQPQAMYVDEYGATDGRWICYATDHGHNSPQVPYEGEVAMLKAIRDAVGPDVALYSEYPPAEVSRQYLDGSFSYQAAWSMESEGDSPSFIDLPRFMFPQFKQIQMIYRVTLRSGNWWHLAFPFFNGEAVDYADVSIAGYDPEALDFVKRTTQALVQHRAAFASSDVAPLVQTEVPGVFANRFTSAREVVWTLYNATGRTVRQPCLRVAHVPGATYLNALTGASLSPSVSKGTALVSVELGPRAVGCVVEKLPGT